MAISDKLNYLIETKSKFKDRLNSLGAEITANTNFRNYLNWLDTFYGEASNKTDLSVNGVVGRTSQDGDPTPENPVEINNLSGDVVYKVSGKNLFNKGNYIELNGTPNTSGTFTGGGANYNIVIPCQSNTTYTIQKRNDGNTNRFAFFCSETIPSDADSVQTRILNGTRNDTASEITITTAPTAKYLIAHYYRNVETALTKQQLLDSIQIEKSSTATSYEPYISESFPLSLKSRNLFDKNNTNILNAYIGGSTGTITNSNGDKCLYISIKPNTTYTISKVLSNRFRIGCTDALPNSGITCTPFSGNKDTSTSYTITSNNSSKYLIIEYYIETDILTEQQILDSIQIEESSTATTYEPYYDINLCNLSNYKDRIHSQNGEFYLEKKTSKVILDETMTYYKSTTTSVDKYYTRLGYTFDSSIPRSAISNRFIYKPNGAVVGQFDYSQNNQWLALFFCYAEYNTSTINDFKNYVKSNETYCIITLPTPTTTEITDENYPTLYSQLLAIQEFLTKYKINKEFLLDYSSPEIEY